VTHIVDQIAANFVTVIVAAATAAGSRVTRDRSTPVEAREDLPYVDIRIGEETAFSPEIQGLWRATVAINVDLIVEDSESVVSATLQALRVQVYMAIMNATFPAHCLRVLPAPAGEVQRNQSGSLAVAIQRTAFAVLYQHSLTDPTA
jgi:hypothetical protein